MLWGKNLVKLADNKIQKYNESSNVTNWLPGGAEKLTPALPHSGPENLKKSRQKNSWNQINPKKFPRNCIFGSFKLFPSSKIDFWSFLELQKMKIDLFVFWPGLF